MTIPAGPALRAFRALPPMTSATAVMYGGGVVLLVFGYVTWVPEKNPRWVIALLTVVAIAFLAWTLWRGHRYSQREAVVMTGVQVLTMAAMTWTTHFELGAFANGTILPIVAVYTIWFLPPVAGRVVLYGGTVAWLVAIVSHDSSPLTGAAVGLTVQTIFSAEVFARIKLRMDGLARTDELTGVMNRRGITEVLRREMSRSGRRVQPLSVVAVDLDGLRTVNNTDGHTAGDRLLTTVTGHWIDRIRRHDAIGRTGGDEFLLVLPGTTKGQAERLVGRLAAESPGSWSAGVAEVKPTDSIESLLERADQRMYAHKSERHSDV